MNKNERITFEKYRKMGVVLNKKGWPDHYYFSNGKLTVVETKAPGDDLTFEQQAVRDFLIAHGVRYIVELVKDGKSVTVYDSLVHANQRQTNPNQANLGQARPLQPMPNHAIPHQSSPSHSNPFQTSSVHSNPNHTTPFHARPRQAGPNHTIPNQSSPIQITPD